MALRPFTVVGLNSPSSHALRVIALTSFIALAGCATSSPAYHRYLMQGQVLAVDGRTLTVCVGDRDGAKAGQVLEVVRHVQIPTPPKQIGPSFRREEIGSVRISSLVDEHYATAEVIEGDPKVNDMVELDKL